jgi:MoaA/NifB/PqqE/SkfB family radical SAM enzyme
VKSPADMQIIQIDITNACTKKCSNCTRFCGNHRKPFMMDFDTFKRAVDSMEGFPGFVGIMGGEPTLHPQFEEFVRYFASRFGTGGGAGKRA